VHSSPQKLAHPVSTVLALLAWEGQPEPDQAARAFDTGMRSYIGGGHTHRLPPREECSLAEFDAALQTLNQSVPAIKRRIVVAARPASWRTSRSLCAKRSCSAPSAIRSTARYRRSSWGKRKDDPRFVAFDLGQNLIFLRS
jgi:hypothetical protein